jgi:beta-xylosidase
VERFIACPEGQGAVPVRVEPSGAPAFADDAPDPDILRVGNTWYAYTTGTTWGNRIGILTSSSPSTGWRTITGRATGNTALPTAPAWQQPDTQWAPGVYAWGGRYVMFYAAQARAHGKWCLSTAASDNGPAGPFVDRSGGPLICQVDLGGSIDPHPFVDADGRPWLHWKNNDGSSPAVSKVWAVPLADDGQNLAGGAVEVMAKNSQAYPWQNTVDNPQMVIINGVHYLFFSGGDWESDRYVVGYAVCNGPTGPCHQPNPNPILSSYGTAWGPAGGNVEVDPSGQWWMSYHAFDKACATYACGSERRFYVAPLRLG